MDNILGDNTKARKCAGTMPKRMDVKRERDKSQSDVNDAPDLGRLAVGCHRLLLNIFIPFSIYCVSGIIKLDLTRDVYASSHISCITFFNISIPHWLYHSDISTTRLAELSVTTDQSCALDTSSKSFGSINILLD